MPANPGSNSGSDLSAPLVRSDEFVDRVLYEVLTARDRYSDEDNLDAEYPADDYRLRADAAVAKRLQFLKFFLTSAPRLYHTLTLLADRPSQHLFLSLILFRILGYRRVRLPVDHGLYFGARQRSDSISASGPPVDGAPVTEDPQVRHFEFSHNGRDWRLDCFRANLFFTFFLRQYFFETEAAGISPRSGDFIVDAGACFGDTAVHFAATVGPEGHVFCFEVLESHLRILELNLRQNTGIDNVTVFPCALGDRDSAGAIPGGEPDPGFSPPETAPSCSLDSLTASGSIPRVDFLKMDIEGGELAALHGAAKTIKRFRPRLAISMYHRPEDYFSLPQFIETLGLGYRMYLANYTISDGETILYATCEPSDAHTALSPH